MILLLNFMMNAFMVGVVWFAQLVHFPMFQFIKTEAFRTFFSTQRVSTLLLVTIPILIEGITSLILLKRTPEGSAPRYYRWGFMLVLIAWIDSGVIFLYNYGVFSEGFQSVILKWLISLNWIRTIAWSLKLSLLFMALFGLLRKVQIERPEQNNEEEKDPSEATQTTDT